MFLHEALEILLPKKIEKEKKSLSSFFKLMWTTIKLNNTIHITRYDKKNFKNPNKSFNSPYKKNNYSKNYGVKNNDQNFPSPKKFENKSPAPASQFEKTATTPTATRFPKAISAYVLYIKSAQEIEVMLNNEKKTLTVSGLEGLYAQHTENPDAFNRFVKTFLFESIQKEKETRKVFLKFEEGSTEKVQIFFDFKYQDSLTQRLQAASENFVPMAASSHNAARNQFKF